MNKHSLFLCGTAAHPLILYHLAIFQLGTWSPPLPMCSCPSFAPFPVCGYDDHLFPLFRPKSVSKEPRAQFEPIQNYLVLPDQGLTPSSRLWFWGGFTPVILVWIKFKSLNVRAKQVRCESTLKINLLKFAESKFYLTISYHIKSSCFMFWRNHWCLSAIALCIYRFWYDKKFSNANLFLT